MKILALDSTALTATVALCDNELFIAQTSVNVGLTHSETLLPIIEELLKHTQTQIRDIELFGVSTGPGSFTGVRIGAATVKGLAFDRNVTCIGVSSLEALARNLSVVDGIICPVMNARREQVYNALFKSNGGKLTRLCPDRAISVAQLREELIRDGYNKVYLCGDGYDMTYAALNGISIPFVPEQLRWQSAYSVAQCALDAYRAGVRTTDAELVPFYLRMPQAERERLDKLKNQ